MLCNKKETLAECGLEGIINFFLALELFRLIMVYLDLVAGNKFYCNISNLHNKFVKIQIFFSQ